MPPDLWRVLSPVYPPFCFFALNTAIKYAAGFSIWAAGADLCLLAVTLTISQFFRVLSCTSCDQTPLGQLMGMVAVTLVGWGIALALVVHRGPEKLEETSWGPIRIAASYIIGSIIFGVVVHAVVPLLIG
jgi:hypothetical protein